MMAVAAAAGVSQATVSLVLSGSKGARLTDETRRRVLQAAQDLGYKFVRRGSRVDPGGQGAIIFMADEIITDPWMSLAFEGARDKALEVGINMLMGVSHADAEVEANILAGFDKVPILGVVYGTILTRLVQIPAALASRRMVLLNCYDEGRAHHSVLPGDVLGGRTATEHLLKAGRKRVGFINGQQGVDGARDRLKGYKQALASNDIPFDAALVRPGNWEPSAGYDMTLELMALTNPPDAIFCANDMMALGCYDALRQLGLDVPRDVAVIGFDDREIAQYMHPPLSTLVLPLYEMGRTAVELILDDAGGLHSSPSSIKVECKLVERESTGSGNAVTSNAAAG
ncbi:LacI family DNA-binding transcriptional regulator [Devosia sp.]|uniref:LacI family DNA-binding transcriptional regulator n=1 Tax=Devosia sp. TaxID=1871048 RepID=UPI002FC7479C